MKGELRINYEIKGGILPVVECHLEAGEFLIVQNGAISWMSPNMEMQTKGGGIGKMFGRVVSGEAMLQELSHHLYQAFNRS